MKSFSEVKKIIEKAGIPGKDLYDLPTSGKTFPDDCHYRVEISGMETVEILKATIDEMKKQKVPFHRAISFVRGAALYTKEELKEFAKVAQENQIEVIATPGPRPTWGIGRQIATPEGAISGLRLRGQDMTNHYISDIFRCIDIGFRGFLVWDEGILMLLNKMRKQGSIPKDITFKVSIFAGHANAAGAKLLEKLGADTFNPVADLPLPALASIRHVINMPMDIHIQLWKSMGGYFRDPEAPEIARVASPCYFKMEQGPGLEMYMPWSSEDGLAKCGRDKIKSIKNIIESIQINYPELQVSKQGPEDLRIPEVK